MKINEPKLVKSINFNAFPLVGLKLGAIHSPTQSGSTEIITLKSNDFNRSSVGISSVGNHLQCVLQIVPSE